MSNINKDSYYFKRDAKDLCAAKENAQLAIQSFEGVVDVSALLVLKDLITEVSYFADTYLEEIGE